MSGKDSGRMAVEQWDQSVLYVRPQPRRRAGRGGMALQEPARSV